MTIGIYKHHSNQGFQKGHRQFAGFQKGNVLGRVNKGRKRNWYSSGTLGKKLSEITKQRMTIAQYKRWSKIKKKLPRYRHIRNKVYL